MTTSLVPAVVLSAIDTGSYVIPPSELASIPMRDILKDELVVKRFTDRHPEYDFIIKQDGSTRAVTVNWNLRKS